MNPGSKRRLLVRIVLSAVMVSGLVAAGGTTALAECRETVYVDAYVVEVEPRRRVYRIGQTAVFDGKVTRRDTGAPVEAADFFVYIPPTRTGFVFSWARTDAAGEAILRMKLKRSHVETGPSKVVGRGQQERANATCVQVVEYGEIRLDRAFVIEE
jgi:hypothetical protein